MEKLFSKITGILRVYYVEKVYFDKIFSGLKPINMLKIALFDNKYKFNQILVKKNTAFYSNCDYLLIPTMGKAIQTCITNGKVIGLSKINHIVQCNARTLHVQQCLTNQIANKLQTILSTENVTVIIDAKHFCVSSGNIRDDT